ncbi:MAG: pilus assembly protein TadG-related protein [Candidatus Sulfopaludibacter sp.]|nr:pilus assembly protein TadG-related protein [Candidatus Sulfopaludibacter sp.]
MPIVSQRSGSSGQAAIIITLSLPVMLGMLGLVTEIGWAYWRQEACRTAAQAAAVAAARQAQIAGAFTTTSGIYTQSTTASCPASPTSPSTNNLMAGCLYAKANGFTNSGTQLVKYSAGTSGSPASGSTPNYWVRYIVTESNPSLFSSVLGYKHVTASGMATAGVFLGVQGACIYALDPTASGAVNLGGNTIVNAGCGVYDNSNSTTALTCSNNTTLNAGNSTINVAGLSACYGSVSPAPSQNQPRTADPFQYLDPPAIPNRCDSNGLSANSTVSMPADGTYVICNGGITMKSNGTLNLPAGTYIIQGGGIDWENGTASGTGVTIYMTGPNPGGIKINGNMGVNLTAPTSGYYWGVLFYQDRSLTSPPADVLNGGSAMNLSGTVYLPGSAVAYSGGSASSVTALIADTVTFTGTSTFGTDTNGAVTGLGRPFTALLE